MILVTEPALTPIVRYRLDPTDKRLPETNPEAEKRGQTGEQCQHWYRGAHPITPELSGGEHV